MRVLRAVYNRAVDHSKATFVSHLFKHVYTGLYTEKKRAVDNGEMARLLNEEESMPASEVLQQTQDYFVLMFLMRGLPFVDLVYLKKTDLCGNVLTYRRRKTGKIMRIVLTADARRLISKYCSSSATSSYLFPFIRSSEGSICAYREYQCALRCFNRRLRQLSAKLNLHSL